MIAFTGPPHFLRVPRRAPQVILQGDSVLSHVWGFRPKNPRRKPHPAGLP